MSDLSTHRTENLSVVDRTSQGLFPEDTVLLANYLGWEHHLVVQGRGPGTARESPGAQNYGGPHPAPERALLLPARLSLLFFLLVLPSGQQMDTRVWARIPQTLQPKPRGLKCWQRGARGVQRSQKPKARVGEERGEHPAGGRPPQHCLFLTNRRQEVGFTREHLRIYIISPQAVSQSGMHPPHKRRGGKFSRERSIWAQTLCWELDITVSGVCSVWLLSL